MNFGELLNSLGTLNENAEIIRFREDVSRPLAGAISKIGVSPTSLNVVGLVFGLLSGLLAGIGNFPLSASTFFLSILADAFDGPLARYLGITSGLGAFLDSVFDRYADIAILSGLVWYYFPTDPSPSLAALATIMGTSITSYAKARAESLGVRKRAIGLMNRPERVIAILIGLCFPQLLPFLLLVLALLTNATAVHRIVFYIIELRAT